ncbi:aminopeptidase P family protein [Acidaminobacter sp. JC074]|uniref:M24 family metallopeptidase n=1 Tax=Acidaminobacter sp. JC074 TaxID=2530199 RepID=UPI001F0F1502|nr:Xaa-Pro peptidase family protein [Acidaminobacter sp. JC074]MCH4891014.1 aminopeptidase P family protein [Acidaminobacter sp. JC074]
MSRIKRLLEQENIVKGQALLVSNESNVKYMSGYTGEAAYLILSHEGQVFMTDGRYDEQARNECPGFEVTKWHNPKRPDPDTILHYLKKFGIKKLIFNGNDYTFNQYTNLKNAIDHHKLEITLESRVGLIEKFRAVKTSDEVENIRVACSIADKALEALLPSIKVGVTELALVGELEYNLKKYGADNISFDTIIVSGTKTALPHGKPSDKKLEEGDFLQIDFGALYKGYHSDMSRTFIIGKASQKQEELYDMMLKATIGGIEALKGNISAKDPDSVVREIISDDYLEYYYPGLGHGVGLDIHEGPFMSNTTTAQIETGNVVTIEPGVYVPGWGGMRIEDTVLVTEDGYEVLSKFPRELQVLS